MAASMSLKPFYITLGAVAVIGIGGLLWARLAGGGGAEVVEPLPVSATGFEGYVMGSDAAPVEVIEYADFQCPACAHFAILTGPDVRQRLVATGQVRWRFLDFPLPMHPNAPAAHLAAACAGEQGRFWEMHDQLFFQQSEWASMSRPARRFRDYARAVGLDQDQFDTCLESDRYRARIEATKQEAAAQGIQSTPTFIVGNLRVSGSLPYDSLKVLVDRATRSAARP